mmetsp:Transcript_39366/g.35055  ORF Transcript_39366/g.35055 Transcript_39366/m.35055 type:complete len:132 (+) Transcript_39366:184-579(+)
MVILSEHLIYAKKLQYLDLIFHSCNLNDKDLLVFSDALGDFLYLENLFLNFYGNLNCITLDGSCKTFCQTLERMVNLRKIHLDFHSCKLDKAVENQILETVKKQENLETNNIFFDQVQVPKENELQRMKSE